MKWLGISLLGLALFLAAAPHAKSAEWQLMRALPGDDYRPRGKVLGAETACLLDLSSDRNASPSGTRFQCIRVKATTEARR